MSIVALLQLWPNHPVRAKYSSSSLNLVYVHGAMNSSEDREKAFFKESERLHYWMSKELQDTKPFSEFLSLDPSYFYWGDLLRQDAKSFANRPLATTLRKSRGKINNISKQRMMPVIYDAEWLQDSEKLQRVLDRLNTTIKSQDKPFVLMGHSAGSLVVYDYLIHRMAILDLRERLTNRYKLPKELAQRIPRKSCMDLIERYDPYVAKISANTISQLEQAFNNVSTKLIEDELSITKASLKESIESSQKHIEHIRQGHRESPICLSLLSDFERSLDLKNRVLDTLSAEQISYETLALAKLEGKKRVKNIEEVLKDVRPKTIQGNTGQEGAVLLRHLQNLHQAEQETLSQLEKLLSTSPGKYSLELLQHGQEVIDKIIIDHEKMCVEPHTFRGLITFGSPLALFRTQQIKKMRDPNAMISLLLNDIYQNGKLWLHFNHAEDFIALSIVDEMINDLLEKQNPTVMNPGLIIDAVSYSKEASLFGCTSKNITKCSHVWYWYFPASFAREVSNTIRKKQKSQRRKADQSLNP